MMNFAVIYLLSKLPFRMREPLSQDKAEANSECLVLPTMDQQAYLYKTAATIERGTSTTISDIGTEAISFRPS